MNIKKLNVFIRFDGEPQKVGQLIQDNKEILFRYHPDFLKTGFNISPFKLQFNSEIQAGPKTPFEGLLGVFADSLPDAWGRLLLKRYISRLGYTLDTITLLDRLSYIGNTGLGAIEYKPEKSDHYTNEISIDLDFIGDQVQSIIKGDSSEIIDLLFEKGGSPGGARPKIYINYNSKDDMISYAKSSFDTKEEAEGWIIKFAADIDSQDIANIEYAYYKMALDAGIRMSKCRLFRGRSKKSYFGTKRFDRTSNEKIHMVSAAGLFHDDYQNSQLDYGILLNEGYNLTKSAKTHEEILRLAAFNLFAHNRDDHSKNFAFLMDKNGNWSLAPAYDLTFSSSSQGHHSTFYAGNSFNPGSKELLELVDYFSIRNGKAIIESVKESVNKWNEFAEDSEVSSASKQLINKTIQRLLKT